MIDRIRALLKSWFSPATAETSERVQDTPLMGHPGATDFSMLQMARTRLALLADYRVMDEMSPEVSHGLSAYADHAVHGDSDDSMYEVTVDTGSPARDEKIAVTVDETDEVSGVRDQLWCIARALAHEGEYFGEIVFNGLGQVEKLKHLPTETMWINVDEQGRPKDPDKYYIQRGPNNEELAAWPEGEVVHFKIAGDLRSPYGRSVLYAGRRPFRQLFQAEDSMVIGRARRAFARYVYKWNVGDGSAADKRKLLDRFKQDHKTRRFIDPATGMVKLEESMLRVEDDLHMTKEDAVDLLAGDTSVNNIADIEYLLNKLLTAIGVPKSILNREQDINGKAVLQGITAQFARKVRRVQGAIRVGLKKFYTAALLAAGHDVAGIFLDVVMPKIDSTDDAEEMATNLVRAQVTQILLAGGTHSREWIMRNIWEMSDSDIEAELKITPVPRPMPMLTPAALRAAEDLKRMVAKSRSGKAVMQKLQEVIDIELGAKEPVCS